MDKEKELDIEKIIGIRNKYLIIRDLCFLFGSILPQKPTKNTVRDYDDLLDELGSKEKGLFNLLVHQMTLLHRINRMKVRGCYVSEKEDILLSLELMGSRLNPLGYMSSLRKQYYLSLESYFGNSIFKREEAMPILGLKKTHSQRVINDFVDVGMLYRHERKGSLGYLYQIMKMDING